MAPRKTPEDDDRTEAVVATKKKDDTPATGLHGYPLTRFQGPGGETDYVDVSSAVEEHNLRAAGYVPAKGQEAPTEAEKAEAAAKADDTPPAATPATTTQTSR